MVTTLTRQEIVQFYDLQGVLRVNGDVKEINVPASCIGGHCLNILPSSQRHNVLNFQKMIDCHQLPWEAKIFARSLFTPNLWSVTFGFPKYPQTKRSLKNCCLDNIQMYSQNSS